MKETIQQSKVEVQLSKDAFRNNVAEMKIDHE